jgi:type VI secretion system protein ImpK
MSQRDEPFDSGGRTVIRSGRSSATEGGSKPDAAGGSAAPETSSATVIFSSAAPQPASSSHTVLYQAPIAGAVAAQPLPRQPAPQQKVAQDALLEAVAGAGYRTANPLTSAAAPLLMLLGHLRLLPIDVQPASLAERVGAMVEAFDDAIAGSLSREDARIARYALCETADDIIANLPGLSRETWAPHAMTRLFFGVEYSGSGFFEALNKVLGEPEKHAALLEFMHACLSLGFQGQYRGLKTGEQDLERVRQDVYDTLRYFAARPDDQLSPRWQGLSAAGMVRRRRVPVWAMAAGSVATVTAAFFLMRALITGEGDALADEFLALNPSAPVVIQRAVVAPLKEEPEPQPVATVVPETGQIDRIRSALQKEIDSGGLTVDTKGDFIVIEINNLLLFPSGSATLKPEFEPLAAGLAGALRPEKGPIKIVGHTDNVKPRKSSAFKSNYDLSVERAKAVEAALAPKIGEASRIAVEGKGEDEPIADNATQDGRAKNRRVDVMIRREELL